MYIIYTMYAQSRHVYDLKNVPGQNDKSMSCNLRVTHVTFGNMHKQLLFK